MSSQHAGIKRHYQTNRQRDIMFAVTVVLYKYDEAFIQALRSYLSSDSSYSLEQSTPPQRTFVVEQQRDDKFILIYYLAKDMSRHLPLILSYCLLFVYLYYSVRKIEMVKSKWGLAFSAVFTIAASLLMACGICVNFDLTPRLWRGDLFPYLAMILGIENTLCLTRSVVSTPVTLPVELRISHGLSREGWLITKNFLIELLVVLVGVLTRIPEIQEFCTLGCIGLVVDFFMQLFFYAPCLTFDLRRFDPADIQKLSVMQLTQNLVELVPYPPVRCPVKRCLSKCFPSFVSYESVDDDNLDTVRRTRSMSSVFPGDDQAPLVSNSGNTASNRGLGHRRAVSNTSAISVNIDPPVAPITAALLRRVPLARRLKLLACWSRYRYCQRIFTIIVVVWIAWLALIAHQWHLISKFGHSLDSYGNRSSPIPYDAAANLHAANRTSAANAPMVESSWVHWALAQRTTFRWWPILFNIYNISLTGEYLIILPRVILNAEVKPERAKVIRSGVEASPSTADSVGDRRGSLAMSLMNDLGMRISWLELQMLAVLVVSVSIFLTVGGFILYVCFVGGNSSDSIYETDPSPWVNSSGRTPVKQTHKRVGSKTLVDAVPLLFSGHEQEVEFVRRIGDILVSACLGGRILIWDAKTADIFHQARPYQARIPTAQVSEDAPIRNRRPRNGTSRVNGSQPPEEPFAFLNFDETSRASIWCLDAQSQLIAAGFSNGDVELYDLRSGLLRGRQTSGNNVGATQLCLKGSQVVVARLNGQLDFMELRLLQHGSPQRQHLQCHLSKSVTAHQRQINRLATTNAGVVTAGDDHTLKLFDLHKYSCDCTFYGHNAPVVNIAVDHDMQIMYTSCSDGLVCIWDLVERCLIRTLPELSYTASPVALAFTSTLLIGHGQDGSVWLWKKSNGDLLTRMKADKKKTPSRDSGFSEFGNTAGENSSVVVLTGNLAVTANRDTLRFWDLEYKAMLREVRLGEDDGPFGSVVNNLIRFDGFSVVCCKGNVLYKVDFPVIRAM